MPKTNKKKTQKTKAKKTQNNSVNDVLSETTKHDKQLADIFSAVLAESTNSVTNGTTCDNNDNLNQDKSIRVNSSTLADIVGTDIASNLSNSENRRLKADIKKGINFKNSKVLQDMMKRCPHLEETITKLINEPQRISDESKKSDKNSDSNVSSKKRKKSKAISKKGKKQKTKKKPRYVKKIKDTVEKLGSEDTDE